jgi:hypothetical protein
MSDFDSASLKWAEANVAAALPCPFCGERLIVHADHHGAWLAHKNETGNCFDSCAQIMNTDNLAQWNKRVA